MDNLTPALSHLIRHSKSHPSFHTTTHRAGNYFWHMAKDSKDLEAIFKLRHDVFCKELGGVSHGSDALEWDEYDAWCDHAVVWHLNPQTHQEEAVGTYRLLPVHRLAGLSLEPYCAREFCIADLMSAHASGLLELGRSCVAREHRGGVVPLLLWNFIGEYLEAHGASHLMGCVSLYDASHMGAKALVPYFQSKGQWQDAWKIRPQLDWETPSSQMDVSEIPILPPLMKGYLQLGAKVCGGPAWDPEFLCHDFLMVLDKTELNGRYLKRFLKGVVAAPAMECPSV